MKFKPENAASLKSRYPAAIEKLYPTSKPLPDNKRPGNNPENIFDFEDGMRIIISKDILQEMEVIHFSGSFEEDVYKGGTDFRSALQTVVKHFEQISGLKGPYHLVAVSDGGIPHFYIKISDLN